MRPLGTSDTEAAQPASDSAVAPPFPLGKTEADERRAPAGEPQPPSEPPPSKAWGGLRPWAVFVGLVLSLLLCVVSLHGHLVTGAAQLTIDYCMAGAMLFMSVLALVVNPLFKLADRWVFRRRLLGLNAGEMTLVFLMLALVSGLVCYGFVMHVLPIATGGAYYADASNQWAELIAPHVPAWMVVTDSHTVRAFYEGLPSGASVPWRPWVVPLAAWTLFGIACFATYISLMAIMRKQWMDNERLVYPIAQVPIELAGSDEDASVLPRIARSPRMWLGAAIPLAITNYNCFAAIWPVLTPIPISRGRLPLFDGMVTLRLDFSFIVMGFSYLLNTQVSLSLWLFQVLYSLQTGYFGFIGFSLGARDPFSHLDPSISHQATGGMVVLVVASIWAARRHLASVVRCAHHPNPALEDPAGVMSYRWAVALFLSGLAGMYVWLILTGMQFWVAGLFLALALGTIYFLARAIAQAGLAAARPVMIPQAVLTHAVGTGAMVPSDITALSYGFVWSADVRTSVMASAANGLRAVAEAEPSPEQRNAWRRTVLAAIVLALVGGLAISYWAGISLAYTHGAVNAPGTWLVRGLPHSQQGYASRLLETGIEVSGGRWIFTAIGGSAMGLLMLARNRLLWWPVHPVGFVLGASAPVQWSWTGIFAAWLLKTLVLRYGGARAYKRTRDMAIGMVVGQVLTAGLWMLLAAFFHLPDVRVPILR